MVPSFASCSKAAGAGRWHGIWPMGCSQPAGVNIAVQCCQCGVHRNQTATLEGGERGLL